ncbi:MAG: carbamoyltransferase C-terminal domain-containing protein, partial [Lentisphaerota bacterium]
MRIILGIQEAHDASAALMVNGKIVAAAQEERFTGLKGDYGFPLHAIAACLEQAGIKPEQIDEVALASHSWNPVLTKIKRNANFKVSDWIQEQHEYWFPKIFENRDIPYYDLYKNRSDFVYDNTYPMDHLLTGYMDPKEMEQMAQLRKQIISKQLGVPAEKIRFVTHEDCHTYYAYFGSPLRGRVLLLTSEGIGDYSNGTVSEFSESERHELAQTKENHIGHIYQYITLILGMKPAQHEYKVMGLAPYANTRELEKSYAVFSPVLKVDGLNIVYDKKPKDLYFHFRDALEGHRFDGIAGGLQKFVENILCEWVQNCIAHTGLRTVCFSGGVAQNIKACKSIGELSEVENLYVCPAAGDTSLSIGTCYYAMWDYVSKHSKSYELIKPVDSMYLGPEFTPDQIKYFLNHEPAVRNYTITDNVKPREIASRLADGNVIARCCGRMEFGLRALGNRSILADPRDACMVRKINDAIKFRDFWMPFTPTILAEREKDYIINPKQLKCPHMTMAFDSTPLAQKDLIAALHPSDLTMRPQILKEPDNPDYYAIIKEFESMTGVGCVLNTSFNLHGDPIVLG